MSRKIGTSIEVDSGTSGLSGIKMIRLTSASTPATSSHLGVDSGGNVVVAPLPSYTRTATSRTLNTNFTPNASKATLVSYSIDITCALTVVGTQSGTVELRSDSATTPTTIIASVGAKLTLGLGIVVGTTVGGPQVLSALILPGDNVRLVTSGSATISITNQSEVTINP